MLAGNSLERQTLALKRSSACGILLRRWDLKHWLSRSFQRSFELSDQDESLKLSTSLEKAGTSVTFRSKVFAASS